MCVRVFRLEVESHRPLSLTIPDIDGASFFPCSLQTNVVCVQYGILGPRWRVRDVHPGRGYCKRTRGVLAQEGGLVYALQGNSVRFIVFTSCGGQGGEGGREAKARQFNACRVGEK